MTDHSIKSAAKNVARLDEAANWASDPTTTQTIDGITWTGAEVIGAVANSLRYRIASYHGHGTWTTEHALRHITRAQVEAMLIAYGATPYTVQEHADRIARILRRSFQEGGEYMQHTANKRGVIHAYRVPSTA